MSADSDATPKTGVNPINAEAGGASQSDLNSLELSGRSLGEFKLLRKLGRGGMAEVYLAEQTSLRRQVAVKVLRQEFTEDASYLKRFQQEASAAGTLNHPNIVQVYVIGEQDGTNFIAQEYVQGRNLKEILARKGPLELTMALVILRQVASALQAAAAKGIVHRDIKPENILLTKKGEAKVADFGLAQLTLHGEKVALTQVGMTMGTPLYMSPEQINGKQLDSRADLYSFGVMAYHMLAGKPPFQGETPLSIAIQHLNSECPPLKKLRSDLPDAVCQFVKKLMEKKRENRYADPQAVLQELKQLTRMVSGKSPETSSAQVRKKIIRRKPLNGNTVFDWSWTRQFTWLIPCCVLLAGSAAGAGWAMRTRNPFETPAQTQHKVEHMATPQAQFYLATMSPGDPEVWQAILDYYGNDPKAELEVGRAELHLAMIDLQNDRLEKAGERLDKMLMDGQTTNDTWKKAHALAGLAVIDSFQGRRDESRQKLKDVQEKLNQKLDAVMNNAIQETVRRNNRP